MTAVPLVATPVPAADVARGDGRLVCEFIENFCRVTKQSVGGNAGQLMQLRQWQKDLISCVYARRPDGRLRHREALIGVPRKNGKLLDVNTPILTADGWRTMGTVREGDYVHAPDGSLTKVSWVSMPEIKEAFAVRFKDGSELIAGSEHEWLVNDRMREPSRDNGYIPEGWKDRPLLECSVCGGPVRGNSKLGICKRKPACKKLNEKARNRLYHKQNPSLGSCSRVVTTAELARTLHCGSRNDRRYTVTVPQPLARATADLPLSPWVLGVWLGDGSTGTGQVTNMDQEVLEGLAKAGYPPGLPQRKPDSQALQITFKGLRADLRQAGVLNRKHIPEKFLLSSPDQRLDLLRGLMDTDGSVYCTGQYAAPECEFSNTNKNLADGVLFLVRSLGWKASIYEGRAMLNGKDCGPKWRVLFAADRQCSPFKLSCKTQRLKENVGKRSLTNAVTAVESAGKRSLCCIAVEHPSHCYLAGRGLTPTHNSALGSAMGLHGLVMGSPGSEVYSLAATREQARIVFGVAKRIVELEPQLDARQGGIIKIYRDVLEYTDRASIYKVMSAEAYSLEGYSPTTVVFDEVHAQPNDELYNVMRLAQGARVDSILLGITTAGVRTDTTGQDSIAFRLYQQGVRIAKGEDENDAFFMAWFGAPPEADHKDPAVWAAANPGYGDIVDAEDFASAVKAVHENSFRQKRLNTFTSAVKAWLPQGAWDVCRTDRDFTPGARGVVLGFDGSQNGDSTALVAVTVSTDPQIIVLGLWEKPRDANSEWRVPRGEVKDRIRQACHEYHVREVACDEFIWQDSLEELEAEGIPIVVFPQTLTRMAPATTRFYQMVSQKTISHDGNPSLARHLENAQLKTDSRGSRLIKDTKGSPRKIDLAVAAVMAVERAAFWLNEPLEGTINGMPVSQVQFVWSDGPGDGLGAGNVAAGEKCYWCGNKVIRNLKRIGLQVVCDPPCAGRREPPPDDNGPPRGLFVG
jgi:phage terminase large subunit-like protein